MRRRVALTRFAAISVLLWWSATRICAQTYGLTTVNAYFPPGQEPRNVVRARYKFRVAANASPTIKILFGWHRFHGTTQNTYLLETNLYSDGVRYADQVCTSWPLQGQYLPAEASLRVAVPDYNLQGKTGAKTGNPALFPRQTYEIDGIPGLWKTDLISQRNLNGQDGTVDIIRGDLITDRTGWKCSGNLDQSVYREWNILVTLNDGTSLLRFALPDDSARYFAPYEILQFGTEFFHMQGLFKIYLWDLEVQTDAYGSWRPLTHWKVVRQDGPTSSFGARTTIHNGIPVIEISNDSPGPFLAEGNVFSVAAPLSFFTLAPCRAIDTRDQPGPHGGPAMAAGSERVFALGGRCGIPVTAQAASVNLTVTNPSASGHISLYPATLPLPLVSTMNYRAGQTRANNAILPLGPAGAFAASCSQSAGTTHLVVDVNGYF